MILQLIGLLSGSSEVNGVLRLKKCVEKSKKATRTIEGKKRAGYNNAADATAGRRIKTSKSIIKDKKSVNAAGTGDTATTKEAELTERRVDSYSST